MVMSLQALGTAMAPDVTLTDLPAPRVHIPPPLPHQVPSATNFDFTAGSIAYDGGVATAGYEFPYDGAQCVFIYNKNKVRNCKLHLHAVIFFVPPTCPSHLLLCALVHATAPLAPPDHVCE